MSKFTVLHLSDIHVQTSKDMCLSKAEAIAITCYPMARNSDAVLIAITGDIAYSGAKHEYHLFKEHLIDPLVYKLQNETSRPVYISMAPGNHDCVLVPSNVVRETVIQAIVSSPMNAENEAMVEACTSVQKEFFAFSSNVFNPSPKECSKLLWQQEFKVGDSVVRVSTLNTAWMSRLPEPQGQLVFPINKFEEQLSAPASVHLALVHHPFNWYSQTAYHNLRKRLRLSCTAILSGHEHLGNSGKIDEQLSGSSLFFEAPALHPPEGDSDAGFSVHVFDLDIKQVTSQAYVVKLDGVFIHGDSNSHSWTDTALTHGTLDITNEFACLLNDAGGNFSHSSKERITLEDVFVWPDVRDWKNAEVSKQQTRSSQELTTRLERGERLIIYGDEKSGKTTLLYWYFRELIAKGYAPVYLGASDLSIKSAADAEKRIEKAIASQYRNPDAIRGFAREKRVLLIDDVDRLKSGVHTLSHLLTYAEKHFLGTCASAASGFEITNLASNDAATVLSQLKGFDLMRFGLKLRHQLIKKWCTLSGVATKPELDKNVHEVEALVNSVIGKRLVPEHPIYLLILLQSGEQRHHGDIKNSGLSFYYQYLITKSLGEVGVKPNELDEHFNYLSILAWRFKTSSAKELEVIEIAEFNQDFTARFVRVELADRLALLTKARILSKRGDCYSFTYPYVYYFFVGLYLAKHLEEPKIRVWVEDSCKKLYLRDRAHSIMFLTHHVESKWVIDTICQVLRECFVDKKPIELNGDTSFMNALVERTSQLTLIEPDIEKNQSVVRASKDEILEQEPNEDPDDYDLLSFASKWNLLHKTAEILGIILKNNYGSLERPQKEEMIRVIFDGPLRALRIWLEEVSSDLPGFLLELKKLEQDSSKKKSGKELERLLKVKVFNIMGWVATSVIASSANFVVAEKLREDVAKVVQQCPTNAYRLIEMASRLLKPGAIPVDLVKKLAEDLHGNPYAFGILQSLGYFHMSMFHTEEKQKQALCHILKISYLAAKAIEVRKQSRTLN